MAIYDPDFVQAEMRQSDFGISYTGPFCPCCTHKGKKFCVKGDFVRCANCGHPRFEYKGGNWQNAKCYKCHSPLPPPKVRISFGSEVESWRCLDCESVFTPGDCINLDSRKEPHAFHLSKPGGSGCMIAILALFGLPTVLLWRLLG